MQTKQSLLVLGLGALAACPSEIDLGKLPGTDTGGSESNDAGSTVSATSTASSDTDQPSPVTTPTGTETTETSNIDTEAPDETSSDSYSSEGGAPPEDEAVQVAVGRHSCALLAGGDVQCWGSNGYGQLGIGNTNFDTSMLPVDFGRVTFDEKVTQIDVGRYFTCALLITGTVRCWGFNNIGQLGVGHTDNIGDDELASDGAAVELPGKAVQVATGYDHACALLENSDVFCWGNNQYGALGTGIPGAIGDNESVLGGVKVALPWPAVSVAAGADASCANDKVGRLRCWGINRALGLGLTEAQLPALGDNEQVNIAPDINVGFAVKKIAMNVQVCAIGPIGEGKCFGPNTSGELGQGNTETVGDDETPADIPNLNLGWPIGSITAGGGYEAGGHWTLAVSQDGMHMRSFGIGLNGVLGLGNTQTIGDDELPTAVDEVVIDKPILQVDSGELHSLSLHQAGKIVAWGWHAGFSYGNPFTIGDDEDPIWAGGVIYR